MTFIKWKLVRMLHHWVWNEREDKLDANSFEERVIKKNIPGSWSLRICLFFLGIADYRRHIHEAISDCMTGEKYIQWNDESKLLELTWRGREFKSLWGLMNPDVRSATIAAIVSVLVTFFLTRIW